MSAMKDLHCQLASLVDSRDKCQQAIASAAYLGECLVMQAGQNRLLSIDAQIRLLLVKANHPEGVPVDLFDGRTVEIVGGIVSVRRESLVQQAHRIAAASGRDVDDVSEDLLLGRIPDRGLAGYPAVGISAETVIV